MSKRIREGDQVMVLSGNEKGKKGVVISCTEERVLVRGLNLHTSFVKKNDKNHPEGGLIRKEAPIRRNKLRVCNPEGKPVKLRARFNEKGEKELFYLEKGEQVLYRNIKKPKQA